jgi:hypothetical protein
MNQTTIDLIKGFTNAYIKRPMYRLLRLGGGDGPGLPINIVSMLLGHRNCLWNLLSSTIIMAFISGCLMYFKLSNKTY